MKFPVAWVMSWNNQQIGKITVDCWVKNKCKGDVSLYETLCYWTLQASKPPQLKCILTMSYSWCKINVGETMWTYIHTYRLGREVVESRPAEKGLGMMVDGKLTLSQQWALAAQKAKWTLGYNKRIWAAGWGSDSPPPLCPCETPGRVLHPVLGPQDRKDMEMLEQVQWRPQSW